MSWNIQKGIGLDLRRDLDRITRVLRSFNADVVGLQEVLREPGRDQAELLARALGMELAWGAARKTARGEMGNLLLVRGRATLAGVHDLAVPRREARACLEAVAEVDGVRVRAFVCHFGLGLRERTKQAEKIVNIVARSPDDAPRLIMGDFNEWHRGPVRRTLARLFDDAPRTPPTHPSVLPMWALDRMAWDRRLTGVVTVPSVGVASDHRPLRAQLTFR